MRALGAVPRLEIGYWPTAARRLETTSARLGVDVWAKLEEECGAWGGNKVRKLEYLLAEARRRSARRVVAYGVGSSSWTAAVALHGADLGFDVVLFLSGAVPEPYQDLYARRGTEIVRLPSRTSAPLAALAARARATVDRDSSALPAGGSGGVGDVGSVHAGIEVARSVREGALPRPAAVFAAAGTGGTVAGLAVGMGMEGLWAPVHAVRVTPLPLGSGPLVAARIRRLRARLPSTSAPVLVREEFHAPGYGRGGRTVDEARAWAAADGLDLDTTYAGKALAALIDTARGGHNGPLLLLATSPGPLPR